MLLNVDLSQAELRVMAVLSGDQWMIGALQEDSGDFFDNYLMPVAYPWLDRKYGSVADLKNDHPVTYKELRTKVKAVQYGLAFGRGARAIAQSLEMPVAEAQNIIDNYLDTARGFAQWRKDVMEAAVHPDKRDLLVSPTGRRFHAEVVTTRNMQAVQREALAFLPQSISSDICLLSAAKVHYGSLSRGDNPYGARIINLVHDAVMFQIEDESGVEEVAQATMECMRQVGESIMGTSVPFLSDYSSGRSWADLE